jgi:YheO-like PAS domain-containing protein
MVDGSADAILAALRPVVDGLAATFGPSCEVVLHDYRQGEQSVVAVTGTVTGRKVGGALSAIGLSVLARGDAAENDVSYLTRTPDGRTVKPSTMPLRDSSGHVSGRFRSPTSRSEASPRPPSMRAGSERNSPSRSRLRNWANMPAPIRFVPRRLPPSRAEASAQERVT